MGPPRGPFRLWSSRAVRRRLRLIPQLHRDRGRPGQIRHERASLARHVVAEASAAAVNELALALAALRAGAKLLSPAFAHLVDAIATSFDGPRTSCSIAHPHRVLQQISQNLLRERVGCVALLRPGCPHPSRLIQCGKPECVFFVAHTGTGSITKRPGQFGGPSYFDILRKQPSMSFA